MTRHIAYVSTAQPDLSAQCIDALLLDARTFNARIGVTGVLLYDGQRFFQYFEGTDYATDQVMSRIRASGRHRQIQLLADAHRQGRELDRWCMGFFHRARPASSSTWKTATGNKPSTTCAPGPTVRRPWMRSMRFLPASPTSVPLPRP